MSKIIKQSNSICILYLALSLRDCQQFRCGYVTSFWTESYAVNIRIISKKKQCIKINLIGIKLGKRKA